jgi:hypothetical protein
MNGVAGARRVNPFPIKVVDVLDRAALELPDRFEKDRELEMEARETLGQT